jgi:recombination protein RecT
MTQSDLKSKLAAKASVPATTANNPANQIQSYLTRMAPEIAKACGSQIKADELGRVALTTIRLNPKLMECNIQSLMAGVMMAAQLGLRIDPTLGQAYLVPYGKEAQFILGYRGMLALIRNSGEVSNIMAHPVYDNDLFILQYGLDEKLEHIPWHCRTDKQVKDGGNFKGAYVVAKLKDGGNAHLYMPKAEIDAHRKRSKASASGPWVTDYEAMALKTVVRGISKWLPMSIDDYRKIAANDETVKTEISSDMADVTDITADQQPVNVGQIEDAEIPMTKEESDAAIPDTAELLQDCYRLLSELSELRGETPDDMIDTLTNKKVGTQIDLQDKPAPYLVDLCLMLTNELAKGA